MEVNIDIINTKSTFPGHALMITRCLQYRTPIASEYKKFTLITLYKRSLSVRTNICYGSQCPQNSVGTDISSKIVINMQRQQNIFKNHFEYYRIHTECFWTAVSKPNLEKYLCDPCNNLYMVVLKHFKFNKSNK